MNKKILTLLVVGLFGIPMAAAASTIENHGVVTGHTTYANMGGFDPDIAAIAGLAESKVVWFNGQTIMSTLGDGFVYAVKSEQCNPLDGVNYEFHHYNLSYVDPNHQPHIVAYYTYECDSYDLTGSDPVTALFGETGLSIPRQHVWITVTHGKQSDGPLEIKGDPAPGSDQGRWYNFATAIDTRFYNDRGEEVHPEGGGRNTDEINNGNSYCEQDGEFGDHVCNEGFVEGEDDEHTHNTLQVDLYFDRADRGTSANNGTFAGTQAGCTTDTYCSTVLVSNYTDPTAGS